MPILILRYTRLIASHLKMTVYKMEISYLTDLRKYIYIFAHRCDGNKVGTIRIYASGFYKVHTIDGVHFHMSRDIHRTHLYDQFYQDTFHHAFWHIAVL